LQFEFEEVKRELTKAQLDVESISQGHRLEIQAHFRDLQRLEAVHKLHQSEKERVDYETGVLQEKLREAEAKV